MDVQREVFPAAPKRAGKISGSLPADRASGAFQLFRREDGKELEQFLHSRESRISAGVYVCRMLGDRDSAGVAHAAGNAGGVRVNLAFDDVAACLCVRRI